MGRIMTKIRDLDGTFLSNANAVAGTFREQPEMAGAQGVMFQCPVCSQGKEAVTTQSGRQAVMGAHYVICWFKGMVPDEMKPGPGRWDASGTGLDDLTLNPSVNLDLPDNQPGSCKWHGWVQNGVAT
jgi:hypothetical protein